MSIWYKFTVNNSFNIKKVNGIVLLLIWAELFFDIENWTLHFVLLHFRSYWWTKGLIMCDDRVQNIILSHQRVMMNFKGAVSILFNTHTSCQDFLNSFGINIHAKFYERVQCFYHFCPLITILTSCQHWHFLYPLENILLSCILIFLCIFMSVYFLYI